MHLRRLALVTFAAPLLFAACGAEDRRDENRGAQRPPFGSTPEQSADPLQPPGMVDGSMDSPDLGTPNVDPVPGNSVPGNNEGQNPDIQLDDPNAGEGTGGGEPGEMTPAEMTPGEMTPGEEVPGEQTPGEETPGEETPGEELPGEELPQPGPAITPVGTVENRGADCQVPALPAGNTLPNSPNLPDPFTRLDGTRITQKSQWICRREEILRQAYQYIYGEKPPKPQSVTGTVSNTQVTVNIQHNGQTASFSANITLPAGQGPFPAVVSFSGSGPTQQIASQGVAVINFNQGSVGSRNSGIFARLYPNNTAGDLAAWAWGASRIVDVLQAAGNNVIDSTRLGVTGCSFLGKAAFATGALDERFALTIPLESGIGGVPSYKIVPQLEPNPTGAGDGPEQPQHAINNGWLPANSLVAQSQRLPVDTHEIIGLVAPRGLLVLGNTGSEGQFYKNLDFRSEHATAIAGREIFAALGVASNISYDSRAVNHCQNTDRFTQAVQASVGKFLLGNGNTTGGFTTDWEGVRVSPDQWVNWTTPTLEGELP